MMAHPCGCRHPGHNADNGCPAAASRDACTPATAVVTATRKAALPTASCSGGTARRTSQTGMRTVANE
jgi:hypothetical protein